MSKIITIQEWYDIQNDEYQKYLELSETLHRIDNLNVELDDGSYIGSESAAAYDSSDNTIYLNKSLINNYGKQDEVVAFFVHELIHFLDFVNIRIINPSNIYNINRKIRDTGFKFSVDSNIFSNVFRKISNINRNNYNKFFEPYTIDLIKFLRENDYYGHSTQNEIRAYVGQYLYWSEIDGDDNWVRDNLFGWQYNTYREDY